MTHLQLDFEDPAFSIGTMDNCLIWSFRAEVTVERIRWALPVHERLKKAYPKFGVLTVIARTVSLSMPADARTLATAITKEFQPLYCGVCEVIEGTGFGASVARSLVAGIRLIARATAPARVFADITSATSWLGPLMHPTEPNRTSAELRSAAERVRAFGVFDQRE